MDRTPSAPKASRRLQRDRLILESSDAVQRELRLSITIKSFPLPFNLAHLVTMLLDDILLVFFMSGFVSPRQLRKGPRANEAEALARIEHFAGHDGKERVNVLYLHFRAAHVILIYNDEVGPFALFYGT